MFELKFGGTPRSALGARHTSENRPRNLARNYERSLISEKMSTINHYRAKIPLSKPHFRNLSKISSRSHTSESESFLLIDLMYDFSDEFATHSFCFERARRLFTKNELQSNKCAEIHKIQNKEQKIKCFVGNFQRKLELKCFVPKISNIFHILPRRICVDSENGFRCESRG